MAERFKANINPDVLVWARQTAGYSIEEAARKIGTSSAILEAWESGDKKPTLNQLRKSCPPLPQALRIILPPNCT